MITPIQPLSVSDRDGRLFLKHPWIRIFHQVICAPGAPARHELTFWIGACQVTVSGGQKKLRGKEGNAYMLYMLDWSFGRSEPCRFRRRILYGLPILFHGCYHVLLGRLSSGQTGRVSHRRVD